MGNTAPSKAATGSSISWTPCVLPPCGRLVYGAALHRRGAGRARNQDARAAETQHGLGARDELAQHVLGGDEIGDNAVAHGPHDLDRLGRYARSMRWPLTADGEHLAPAAWHLHRDHGWLVDDDAAAHDVHQRVRRAEVDRDIVGEHS